MSLHDVGDWKVLRLFVKVTGNDDRNVLELVLEEIRELQSLFGSVLEFVFTFLELDFYKDEADILVVGKRTEAGWCLVHGLFLGQDILLTQLNIHKEFISILIQKHFILCYACELIFFIEYCSTRSSILLLHHIVRISHLEHLLLEIFEERHDLNLLKAKDVWVGLLNVLLNEF
jgi:hypothetical protein